MVHGHFSSEILPQSSHASENRSNRKKECLGLSTGCAAPWGCPGESIEVRGLGPTLFGGRRWWQWRWYVAECLDLPAEPELGVTSFIALVLHGTAIVTRWMITKRDIHNNAPRDADQSWDMFQQPEVPDQKGFIHPDSSLHLAFVPMPGKLLVSRGSMYPGLVPLWFILIVSAAPITPKNCPGVNDKLHGYHRYVNSIMWGMVTKKSAKVDHCLQYWFCYYVTLSMLCSLWVLTSPLYYFLVPRSETYRQKQC